MQPLVTIGIVFYNAQAHILETLHSVYQQTHQPIELVLYDDASEDESGRIVNDWLYANGQRFVRVHSITGSENKGPSFGASQLLECSTGIYFQLLGADDLIYPNKVSDQVKLLEETTEYDIVFSNADRIDEQGHDLTQNYYLHQAFKHVMNGRAPSGSLYEVLLDENIIPSCAWLARTESLRSAGGYNPNVFIEDWDLWLRVAMQYKFLYTHSISSAYRIRSSSIMHSPATVQKAFCSHLDTLSAHVGKNKTLDQLLAPHFNRYAVGLYRAGAFPTRYLLTNAFMNRNIKSFAYLLLSFFRLRISFS